MPDRALTFGRYRLEPRVGLMSGDREVRLTPKALALLSFIADRPGEVITKEELFGAVWPEVAVGDAALVTCIQELRKALGDNARRPRYIETLHRRGYRFIGKSAPARKAAGRRKRPRSAAARPPSIAVLPFDNMSGDPDQEYFADGMSEDLITGLSRIHWLFVIARNSTFVYKNRAVDVKQVARELGVRYVLEGSVRRAGTRLRISAQLIDADDRRPSLGRTLRPRARRYLRRAGRDHRAASRRRSSRSVLAAEGVRALSRSADDLGAWELVARAQTHFWRMTKADYGTAIAALDRAVEAYPDYAPARSLLGFCLVFAAHMGWIDRDRDLTRRPRARHARHRARRSRSLGTHRARLLGADGTAHRGIASRRFGGRSISIRIPRPRTRTSATALPLRDRTARPSRMRKTPSGSARSIR